MTIHAARFEHSLVLSLLRGGIGQSIRGEHTRRFHQLREASRRAFGYSCCFSHGIYSVVTFAPNKSPEPTGIVAVRLSAGVVGLFIFSDCRWLSFFR
jgi:hypothetical protein